MKKFLYVCVSVCMLLCSCDQNTSPVRYEGGIATIVKFSSPDDSIHVLACYQGVDSTTGLGKFTLGRTASSLFVSDYTPFIHLNNDFILFNWQMPMNYTENSLMTWYLKADNTMHVHQWYLLPKQWTDIDNKQEYIYADTCKVYPIYDILDKGISIYYTSLCEMLDIPCSETVPGSSINMADNDAMYRWREINPYEKDPEKVAQYDRWFSEYADGLNMFINQGEELLLTMLKHHGADIIHKP